MGLLAPNSRRVDLQMPPQGRLDDDLFFAICQANRDYRIERNARGDIQILPPTGGLTGKEKLRPHHRPRQLGEARRSGPGLRLIHRLQSPQRRHPLPGRRLGAAQAPGATHRGAAAGISPPGSGSGHRTGIPHGYRDRPGREDARISGQRGATRVADPTESGASAGLCCGGPSHYASTTPRPCQTPLFCPACRWI